MAEFKANAVVTLEETEHVLARLLDHLEEHAKVERTADGARISSPFGSVEVVRAGENVLLEATSSSNEILGMIKMFIAEHIFEFATGVPSIVWSGDAPADPLPAHFQEIVVTSARDLTPHMRRLTFSCPNAARFLGDVGYHVRLLLPPAGRAPRWPTLAQDGRMEWPSGDDTLISRVYTIRSANADAGTLTIDFALHAGAGSPGATFARQARPGDVIGLLGPGGDGCPTGEDLLLLGDEAALPAMARMLEDLPANCRVEAIIEVESEAEEQDLSSQAQMRVSWLHRNGRLAGQADALVQALGERMSSPGAADRYVWAGCEQRVAARMREILRSRQGTNAANHRIYGYWKLPTLG